jgi:uroporphyrinogen-III synthase
VLGDATVVLAEPALWPLVREAAPGVPVAAPPAAGPAAWPRRAGVVRLYRGDGLDGSAADRAALAGDRPFELVAGLAAGAVAAADETLGPSWRARRRPLAGRSVVITRAAGQQASLAGPLRRLGAHVIAVPTIAIVEPDDGGAALRRTLAQLDAYRWLVLTSANGARALLEHLTDARALAGVRLAAIGPATAQVLADARLPADLVPEQYVAEALLAAFPPPEPPGRVALVRAAVARDVLPEGLRAAGWEVDVVPAYRTDAAEIPPDVREAVAGAEAATFSSPSTVHRFIAAFGASTLAATAAIAIGPVTAAALAGHGIGPAEVATRYDAAGLVDAVVRWASTATDRGA